mmetsp:Transcript_17737/g.57379  ORF Transcript_17737/g.57379 Transcript_17737/m.57379 type:complete len:210 (-) Transcript_17737:140-769(-)
MYCRRARGASSGGLAPFTGPVPGGEHPVRGAGRGGGAGPQTPRPPGRRLPLPRRPPRGIRDARGGQWRGGAPQRPHPPQGGQLGGRRAARPPRGPQGGGRSPPRGDRRAPLPRGAGRQGEGSSPGARHGRGEPGPGLLGLGWASPRGLRLHLHGRLVANPLPFLLLILPFLLFALRHLCRAAGPNDRCGAHGRARHGGRGRGHGGGRGA